MRAVMYPRVSTDLQRDNYSIPSQIKDMLHYAESRGYVLVGDRFVDPITGKDTSMVDGAIPAFVDDYTSTELSRPGLNACLSFLKNVGFDVLLVHAIDRLARDPYYRQTIEREFVALGARVEYILGNYDESPEGEVRKDLDSTFAKWENAKRVERTNRGKKRKAEMGKFVAGNPPYGYRIDPEALGGLAIYEPEAEIIQLIFKWYVEDRYSVYGIVKELGRQGIKTQYEYDTWHPGTVFQMLKHTVYAGYTYYNQRKRKDKKHIKRDKSEWIKIACTPIVPLELFEAAQERLKYNKEHTRKQTKHFYLLSKMVVCSECHRVYLAQNVALNARGYRHRLLQGHCCNRWIPAKKLEPLVWEQIVDVLLNPGSLRRGYEKMMEKEQEKQGRNIKHLEAMQAGVEKLLAKRSRLQQVYLDPDIGMSKEEYLAEKKLLDDQIRSLQEDMDRIGQELSKIPTEADLVNLEEMAEKIVTSLGNNLDIPEEAKRKVLELLNVKVIISPDKEVKVEGWFSSETNGFISQPSRQ